MSRKSFNDHKAGWSTPQTYLPGDMIEIERIITRKKYWIFGKRIEIGRMKELHEVKAVHSSKGPKHEA